MQIKVKQNYKSIPAGLDFELPPFTVLTGENGSGKTHLFEALNSEKNAQIFVDGNQLKSIRYIAFGELNPRIDENCDSIKANRFILSIWSNIQQAHSTLSKPHNTPTAATPEQDPILKHINNQNIKELLLSTSKSSGVMPSQITEDIFTKNIDVMKLSNNDPFSSEIALIFKERLNKS